MMKNRDKPKRRTSRERRRENRQYAWEDKQFTERHRRKYRRNYSLHLWMYHSKRRSKLSKKQVYSKIAPAEIEFLWIKLKCPSAILEHKFVPNYQNTRAYRRGEWDGKAWFVTFEDPSTAADFLTFCSFCLK